MQYVILIYILMFLIQVILDILNIINSKKELPDILKHRIDNEKFIKTKEYVRVNTIFSLLLTITSYILIFIFLLSGLMYLYNNWIETLTNSIIFRGVIFFILLGIVQTILYIPADLVKIFIIEKNYGFNKTTKKTWFSDLIKSLIIEIILLTIIILPVFYLVMSVKYYWIFIWIVLFLFKIFINSIYPIVILPIFNKLTPYEGDITESICKLGSKTGLNIKRIFTMDASKRTAHSNAFFTGIGRTKKIILFDTLLEQLSGDEILAVIAHEIGHWKLKHNIKGIIQSEILTGILLYIAWLFLEKGWIYNIFGLTGNIENFYVGFFLIGILASPVFFFLTPLTAFFSRKREYQADSFAVQYTGAKPLCEGLIKLNIENLSNLNPHPLYALFYYSHPVLTQRIMALNKINTKKIEKELKK